MAGDRSKFFGIKMFDFKHFTVSPEDVSLTYKIFAKILQGVNMTKNIMSIAAAAAIITSGASAFETNTTEVGGATPLLNINGTQGAYVTLGLLAPAPVEVSLDHIGDALLFPAFKSEDGWGTEIVVDEIKITLLPFYKWCFSIQEKIKSK